jgi:uncharacterized Rmd1/YagE family protein
MVSRQSEREGLRKTLYTNYDSDPNTADENYLNALSDNELILSQIAGATGPTKRKRRALRPADKIETQVPKSMIAFNVSESLNIAKIYDDFDTYEALEKQLLSPDIFVAVLSGGRYLLAFEFGVLVFWGFVKPEISRFIPYM